MNTYTIIQIYKESTKGIGLGIIQGKVWRKKYKPSI